MWVPTMKVGMYVWQRHFWSLTYTLYWVKLLLAVCGTKPICVWFTKLFLMDVWSLFMDITFPIQQCFLLCVIRVTGCWTTSGFNRVGVNLDYFMVIRIKRSSTLLNPTLKNLKEIRVKKGGVTGGWVSLWCTTLWTVTVSVVCTLFADLGVPVFFKNCPDCSFFS